MVDNFTPEKDDWTTVFLISLAQTPNVTAASRAAGISRQAAYNRRNADPEFSAAWDDALEQSTDALVEEAYRRAYEGTERPVFYRGQECGRIREYSDTLAIFLLKAHRRATYGDQSKVDMTSGGKELRRPITIVEVHHTRPQAPAPEPEPDADEPLVDGATETQPSARGAASVIEIVLPRPAGGGDS
jgi:hypothetical protein